MLASERLSPSTRERLHDGLTHPRWLLGFMLNGMPQFGNIVTADSSDVEVQAAVMHRQLDASFSWPDEPLRGMTP